MNILQPDEGRGEFFKMLASTDKSQVLTMELKPGEDSGPEEIHKGDQIAFVLDGEARVIVNGEEGHLKKGEVLVIPAGAQHHFYNDSAATFFSLNVYSLPEY